LSSVNVAALQSFVYLPLIQAVYDGCEPGVKVTTLTVTVRSEPKLLADWISADVPYPSKYPLRSLQLGVTTLQSGLEGSLLRVLPEVTVTCTVIKCTREPLVALKVIEYWPLAA